VGPVEGVGIHVEDGFAIGGGRSRDHGSRKARADDDQVEGGRLDWRVRGCIFAHGSACSERDRCSIGLIVTCECLLTQT